VTPARWHGHNLVCVDCIAKAAYRAFRAKEAAIRTRWEQKREAQGALDGQMAIQAK
jgi:hypothetical protein